MASNPEQTNVKIGGAVSEMGAGKRDDVDQEHEIEQRHLAREHAHLRLHQFRIVRRNLEQRPNLSR